MSTIQKWVEEYQQQSACDFVGIACNVAEEHLPKEIRWLYVTGNHSEAYQKIRLQIGRGIAGMVWKTARTQLDQGILGQPEKLIEYPIARLEKLQVALATPVIDQGEVKAVLLTGYRENHVVDLAERADLEAVAVELGQLLKEEMDE